MRLTWINYRKVALIAAISAAFVAVLSGCTSGVAAPAVSGYPISPKPTQVRASISTPIPVTPTEPAPTLTTAPTATAVIATGTTALPVPPTPFDPQRAFQDVAYQMSLGPRTPGSQAHEQQVKWMQNELAKNNWNVELQETTRMDHPVRNVIAKRGSGSPWTIIGAHYDSRMHADQDPDPAKHDQPVPAANDGASGIAVLMELSRVLPKDINGQVWLVFIDAEDQGEISGWDWLLGSRAVAESLTTKPDSVIIIDMIGDANLNIYTERNSDPQLTAEIWTTASELGYEKSFIPQAKWSMIDDHTPFLEKGIRAIDIIDFDYPFWHTTQDTLDKVSPASLMAVGDTLLHWLVKNHAPG